MQVGLLQVAHLQWRAGQLPGRTGDGQMESVADLGPSMEGRTIARPNDVNPSWRGGRHCAASFNGGPDNCPAELSLTALQPTTLTNLQWRAGQLPVRTGEDSGSFVVVYVPSMEGRTIARPNQGNHREYQHGLLTFSGGPDNCPAEPAPEPSNLLANIDPSMEGRTIARPNDAGGRFHCLGRLSSLQWRAGQLPGRTRSLLGSLGGGLRPSMEGRTIAQPNCDMRVGYHLPPASFNGGPDNCPAELRSVWVSRLSGRWSASFNGGPDNCPAEPVRRHT